jgi:hypothetical protein
LLLIEHIRAAAAEPDVDALVRHSVSLGLLDRDVLSYVERQVVIEPRSRAIALAMAVEARTKQRDENWTDWATKAEEYRKDHPDASERAVAEAVAHRCDAKPETVRWALRLSRRGLRAKPETK